MPPLRARETGANTVASAAQATAALQAGRRPRGLNGLDVFFVTNGALFVLMCVFAYYDRWLAYMGGGRVTEFLFYAAVILAALALTRSLLPRRPLPVRLLVIVEIGILAHFAGGFVHFGGARLYDHFYAGLRYDKFVHAANAFIGALAVIEICRLCRLRITGVTRSLAFFSVLGLGAVIEIAEYVVTRTIPGHGVGGYADTIADLTSNVCGGLLFLVFGGRMARALRDRPAPVVDAVP